MHGDAIFGFPYDSLSTSRNCLKLLIKDFETLHRHADPKDKGSYAYTCLFVEDISYFKKICSSLSFDSKANSKILERCISQRMSDGNNLKGVITALGDYIVSESLGK